MEKITVKQALERLNEAGLADITEATLRYKLNTGKIQGEPPPKNNPKDGWKINADSLDAFIADYRPDFSQLHQEIARLTEELEATQTRNQLLEEELQAKVHAEFPDDISPWIYEESEKLGITYSRLVHSVEEQLRGIGSYEPLIRLLVRRLLQDELRQLYEGQANNSYQNPYLDKPISDLIFRWKELRMLAGGRPTTGELALEYLQIEDALVQKGAPPLGK